jgi:hypothetical protein
VSFGLGVIAALQGFLAGSEMIVGSPKPVIGDQAPDREAEADDHYQGQNENYFFHVMHRLAKSQIPRKQRTKYQKSNTKSACWNLALGIWLFKAH